MHHYRKLSVWRKAHDLTVRLHAVASGFRGLHRTLVAPALRAARSIPANIAEGSGRTTSVRFAHHLQVAIGSARELDYLLQLALDVGALTLQEHATLEARTDEVTGMLVSLRRTVVSRAAGGKRSTRGAAAAKPPRS